SALRPALRILDRPASGGRVSKDEEDLVVWDVARGRGVRLRLEGVRRSWGARVRARGRRGGRRRRACGRARARGRVRLRLAGLSAGDDHQRGAERQEGEGLPGTYRGVA